LKQIITTGGYTEWHGRFGSLDLSIVLIVLLSIQNVFAEEKIQRLESQLLNLPDDTVKLNTLIKLGEYYIYKTTMKIQKHYMQFEK